jgi:hypothetical protein
MIYADTSNFQFFQRIIEKIEIYNILLVRLIRIIINPTFVCRTNDHTMLPSLSSLLSPSTTFVVADVRVVSPPTPAKEGKLTEVEELRKQVEQLREQLALKGKEPAKPKRDNKFTRLMTFALMFRQSVDDFAKAKTFKIPDGCAIHGSLLTKLLERGMGVQSNSSDEELLPHDLDFCVTSNKRWVSSARSLLVVLLKELERLLQMGRVSGDFPVKIGGYILKSVHHAESYEAPSQMNTLEPFERLQMRWVDCEDPSDVVEVDLLDVKPDGGDFNEFGLVLTDRAILFPTNSHEVLFNLMNRQVVATHLLADPTTQPVEKDEKDSEKKQPTDVHNLTDQSLRALHFFKTISTVQRRIPKALDSGYDIRGDVIDHQFVRDTDTKGGSKIYSPLDLQLRVNCGCRGYLPTVAIASIVAEAKDVLICPTCKSPFDKFVFVKKPASQIPSFPLCLQQMLDKHPDEKQLDPEKAIITPEKTAQQLLNTFVDLYQKRQEGKTDGSDKKEQTVDAETAPSQPRRRNWGDEDDEPVPVPVVQATQRANQPRDLDQINQDAEVARRLAQENEGDDGQRDDVEHFDDEPDRDDN